MPNLAIITAAVTLAGVAVLTLAAFGGVALFRAYYDWWEDCESNDGWGINVPPRRSPR